MSRADRIRDRIIKALKPEHLEIINESQRHAGHGGDDGSGETHYQLIIVSLAFEGCNRIQRHRMVFDLLGDEFSAGLHALSLRAMTPGEHSGA